MREYKPLTTLPVDIQIDWQAQLHKATPNEFGAFRLVGARRTGSNTYESQRITVLVVDENSLPMSNVPVAFAYSTADRFTITPDYRWTPPQRKAFVVPTHGSGEIDQVQGSPLKRDQPGGVTVFILTPEYASDYVTGCGMLADHTGLHLTFALRRAGVMPLQEKIAEIEDRLDVLTSAVKGLMDDSP